MTTHRTWSEQEDNVAIEMFCQGRSIDYIRLHLLRPEGTPSGTANAINARMKDSNGTNTLNSVAIGGIELLTRINCGRSGSRKYLTNRVNIFSLRPTISESYFQANYCSIFCFTHSIT